MAALPRIAFHETAAAASALEEHGAVVLEGALPAELCREVIHRIDALQAAPWDAVNADGMDRYLCVFNRDAAWLRFLDRPGIIDTAEHVLGENCHVIGMTAWRCHPGFQGEPLHVDYLPITWPAHTLPATIRIPAFILTAHFYLHDIDQALAPTRVVAGSHRAGRAPFAGECTCEAQQPEPVLAAAGDVLLFRSDVWHSGSDNLTASRTRYLLQVHYGRREMAQHFVPFIDFRIDPAVLAAATPRQRRLLGDHSPGPYD